MFLFAVAHGARAQEICNLRLSDVKAPVAGREIGAALGQIVKGWERGR
jgi:hypothetical protein